MRKKKRKQPPPPDRGIAARFERARLAELLGQDLGSALDIRAAAVNLPSHFHLCGASADFELLAEDPAAPPPADGKPKLKRFAMVAYTGAAMRLRGFPYPVVVDLAGMAAPKQANPIYRDHDASRIVGHTDSVSLTAQRIKVAGVISGVGDDAAEVQGLAANGFPWQASIGADATKLEYVDQRETVKVNGQNFTGPLYVARGSILGEISFVPRGADPATSATVAAAANQGNGTMTYTEWLAANGHGAQDTLTVARHKELKAQYRTAHPKPPKVKAKATPPTPANDGLPTPEDRIKAQRTADAAEIARVNAIRRLCAAHADLTIEIEGKKVNLQEHAILAGMDLRDVELAVLRGSRPAGPFGYATGGAPETSLVILEAAALQAGNLPTEVLHHGAFAGDQSHKTRYSDQVMSAAHQRYRGRIGLQQLLVEAARLNGYRGEVTINGDGAIASVLHAMFYQGARIEGSGYSDGGISNLLANVQNKFLLAGYMAINASWRLMAAVRGVKDFKPTLETSLLGDFVYKQVGPDGELKHAVMGDQAFSNQANTYGRVHTLARKDIINDDLGALTTIPMKLGRGAMLQLNNVVWALFMNPGNADDGNPFWNTTGAPKTHGAAPAGQVAAGPNKFAGASSALSSAALQTALALFRNQVDPNGQPIAIDPRVLLVGPTNEVPAEQLLKAPNLVGTGVNASNAPNYNAWANKQLVPAVSPYLENASFTGFSATAWYLLADPNDMPVIQVCFLNGQETPTVQVLLPPPGMLGIPMQGFFDLGAAMFNFRGGIQAVGA